MKKIFKCTMMVIGTIIGAGFASGKEIYSFFSQFFSNGIIGMIVATFLFGIVTYFTLSVSKKQRIDTYQELIKNNVVLSWLIKVFIFICFCIMLSGIGTYMQEEWSVSFWIGTVLTAIICFFIFLFQLHGIEKINLFFVPIIILGIILVYFLNDKSVDITTVQSFQIKEYLLKNWFQSAVLYVGYNSIVLIPILLEMKKYQLNHHEMIGISGIVIMILCLMGLMICFTLSPYGISLQHVEMPMIAIAKTGGIFLYIFYSIVMLLAIFTTAVSAGYAFLKMNRDKNYFRNSLLLCLIGILVARIGFANLVNMCFPLFGYLGIIQMIYIIVLYRKIK